MWIGREGYLLSTAKLLPCLMVTHRVLLQGAGLQICGINVLGHQAERKTEAYESNHTSQLSNNIINVPSPLISV